MRLAVRRSLPGLTTQALVVAILFVSIATMAVRQPMDSDTWWHLKSGQVMWEQGEILRTDPFSHTAAGEAWIDYGWLYQLGLWPVYSAFGIRGLSILLAAFVTGAFFLVYRQCPGKPFVAAFATLLGTLCSAVMWTIRPQSFSLLLTAVVAYLLFRYQETHKTRWLWPLPFLVAVWVNVHGGFVVAFVLLGCYILGGVLNRATGEGRPAAPAGPLVAVTLVSLAAIVINPNTVDMIPYAYQTASIGPLQLFIGEWASPDFHQVQFQPFIWLLLVTLVALGLSRQRADWTELLLVAVFGYMALMAGRFVALFALVAPPVLARHGVVALDELAGLPRLGWLRTLTRGWRPVRTSRGAMLLNVTLLVAVVGAAGLKVGVELASVEKPTSWGRNLPVEAAAYIETHDLPGRMFNTYNWGGYLIWALYPEQPVFVDGRTDLYALNSSVLDDYTSVHWIRPGWQDVLDRYEIGFVITERTGLLDEALALAGGWKRVYDDVLAVIYVRTGEGS